MKKVGIGLGVVVVGVLIFFAIRAASDKSQGNSVEPESTVTETETSASGEEKLPEATVPAVAKAPPTTAEGKEKLEAYVAQLDQLVESNRQEVEECEAGIDRIFGSNIDNDSDPVYSEDSLIPLLDDFEQTQLVPKSSSKLLEILADDQLQYIEAEELGNKLKDLRPCRPYKKMTFIHNLMANFKKNKWSEATKKKVLGTTFNYFERELADRTTLSNLNMQAALLQTMVSEGVLPKKYEEKVLDFKDELEDSYDELLDKADELREDAEEKGDSSEKFIPVQIIKQEYQLEPKQRESFLTLLGELKKDMNL
jgi:hypothetical protein